MEKLLSQVPRAVGGPFSGIGPIGVGGAGAGGTFANVLSAIIGFLTLMAGLYFIFLLISGGLAWMSAGGDKGKLASARGTIFSGVIGLAIVVAAIFIVQLIGGLIGLTDVLDPVGALLRLGP
jgi:hypothetical protein